MTPAALKTWNKHQKEYHDVALALKKTRAQKQARLTKKYEKIIEPSRTKYYEARNKADAVYNRERKPLWKKREEAIAPATESFRKAKEMADALMTREKRKLSITHNKLLKAALNKFEKATGSRWP